MAKGMLFKAGALGALAAGLALIAAPASAQYREGGRHGGWNGGGEGRAEARAEGRGWNGESPRRPARQQAAPQQAAPRQRSWAGSQTQQPARGEWQGGSRGGQWNGGDRANRPARSADGPSWRPRQVEPAPEQARTDPPVRQDWQGRAPGYGGDRERNRTYRDGNRNGTYRDANRDGTYRDANRDGSYRDGRSEGGARAGWRGNDRNWNREGYRGDRDERWRNQGWRGHDRREWNRDWRRDNRYDWRRYRDYHRDHYRLGRYYAPYRNYYYSRIGIGFYLDSLFFSSRYWIADPWYYRLPEVYGPYRWVRYYDDVLLVDIYSGEVVDVIYGFFW